MLDGRRLFALGTVVVALSFMHVFLLLEAVHAVHDQHLAFDQFVRDPMWSSDGSLPAFVGTAKVRPQRQ